MSKTIYLKEVKMEEGFDAFIQSYEGFYGKTAGEFAAMATERSGCPDKAAAGELYGKMALAAVARELVSAASRGAGRAGSRAGDWTRGQIELAEEALASGACLALGEFYDGLVADVRSMGPEAFKRAASDVEALSEPKAGGPVAGVPGRR